MIVYDSDLKGFRKDVLGNRIEERIRERFTQLYRQKVPQSEVTAWKNSLAHMDRVLGDASIPEDAGVAVEFFIPGSTKRMDFVITGMDDKKRKTAIIVELKQWTDVARTTKDAVVETFLGGGRRETNHPSYQAWSYSSLLEEFNEAVRDTPIHLRPCAYLHNCADGGVIRHEFYRDHIDRAPAFLRDDAEKLRLFISQHIRFGDKKSVMFEILNDRVRPSKNLADSLVGMLKGNPEFTLIDDQKLVFETALQLAKAAQLGQKQVLIVEGGPGTGKTVVAVNLLVRLIEGKLNARYITKNAAPRAVYEAKLKGSFKKTAVSNLFGGADSLHTLEPNTYDALIVDEAHRLREKSGMFGNLGQNQVMEAVQSARFSIFFVDDAQRVTLKDVGSVEAIRGFAAQQKAEVTKMTLESQFRCNGSDGYLGWVDNTLGIRPTANQTLEGINYDFRVCSSPAELRDLIVERNRAANKARMVAGYCWDWKSKKQRGAMDIVFPEFDFHAQWNLTEDGGTWIMRPDSVKQVGCIHTCQGLEVDYVGVILGHDYVVRKGKWVSFPERRSRQDSTTKGFGKFLLNDRVNGQRKIDETIRNTYRTLMTRGSRGCYVYSVDAETNTYLESCIGAAGISATVTGVGEITQAPELPFRLLDAPEVSSVKNKVRVFMELKSAAGAFLSGSEDEAHWAELPEPFQAKNDLFIVQVRGESMNRRIPNGSWCLFRHNSAGSRNEKIVLVQHRSISDPENGGSYTVKRYRSVKAVLGDSWAHDQIVLWPESTDRDYLPLSIHREDEDELSVIGEFVALIG